MNESRPILRTALAAIALAGAAISAAAQQPFSERFFAHNAEMTKLQPSFVTPLVASDPRLIQYARFAVSNEYTAERTRTDNFGNNRGAGIIAFHRFEFDWIPPGYIEHNSAAKDGAGDTAAVAKVRIASGDAEHGNFEVSALLNRCFPTGSYSNGAPTGTWTPTIAGGYAFHRHFDVISTLGGTLPTGQIARQGRTIAWNALIQDRAATHVWFELENNSTFFFAGPHDGRVQNFLTPAALYVFRRREWKPSHPFVIAGGGMQVAASRFHTYNHNLIADMRFIF